MKYLSCSLSLLLVVTFLSARSLSAAWQATLYDFQIRAEHPRIATTPEKLAVILSRMNGPFSRDPYARWFTLIKQKEDESSSVSLCNLALIYLATGESGYLTRLINRWPTSGDPSIEELYALDLVFDEIPDFIKLNVMGRVGANSNCWYYDSVPQSNRANAGWGYHGAYGVYRALAYAGIFALTPLEENKDPDVHPFNCLNYLNLVHDELSPGGYFSRIERRIAGDPANNDALPGSYGGMYDNFGYDTGEESNSIHVIHEYENLTGNSIADAFLHDKYRATFFQNFQYPHIFTRFETNQWAHRAGTEIHTQARIWYTQTDSYMPASHAAALTASMYGDERMQDYAVNGIDVELTGYDYDLAFRYLMYFDDSLATAPPRTNPTAYYAGGPGLVSMRSDWSNDAAFAVFACGEGISRRYEDANSFILHRKTNVIPVAGARIRFNQDNTKHHWYHIRSASKNTLKIFDPQESRDRDYDNGGRRGALHSGPQLVASDNLGGQMFETATASSNGEYSTGPGPVSSAQDNGLSYTEMGNIVKYEHVPGQYTYTVGDATEAYTKKIDYFEREFLFLRPDVFVIFDRVKSVDPGYRKVWTIHTVDEPKVQGETSHGMGLKRAANAQKTVIADTENITYIDTVFPVSNRIGVRGGDTVLVQDKPLNPSNPIGQGDVVETDIPRWIELYAIGGDIDGSVTITGDAEEGLGVSETVTFSSSNIHVSVSSKPTSTSTTTLQDTSRHWLPDQWAGYVLRTRRSGGGEDVIIAGNTENTLQLRGTYNNSGVWGYYIMRPIANSYYHWKSIHSITTADMDVENLIVSIPHYFDTEDAYGNVYSFSPHTDGRNDAYRKRDDIGRWTLEIESSLPATDDVFLNVISLKDPGVVRPEVHRIKGSSHAGAVIGNKFVLFAGGKEEISSFNVAIHGDGPAEGFIFNLKPSTQYYYGFKGSELMMSENPAAGSPVMSSPMGVAKINATLTPKSSILLFFPLPKRK
jgi:hypothetical protein